VVILLKVAVNFSHKAVRSESAVSSTAISAKVHFSVLDEAEKALDKKSDETQKHPILGSLQPSRCRTAAPEEEGIGITPRFVTCKGVASSDLDK
jgi:hypothetical protein